MWGFGDLGIWGCGDLGIWGFGDLGMWGSKNKIEARKYGSNKYFCRTTEINLEKDSIKLT